MNKFNIYTKKRGGDDMLSEKMNELFERYNGTIVTKVTGYCRKEGMA